MIGTFLFFQSTTGAALTLAAAILVGGLAVFTTLLADKS